jgi:hypothetical protein
MSIPYFYSVVVIQDDVIYKNHLIIGEVIKDHGGLQQLVVACGPEKGRLVHEVAEELAIKEIRLIHPEADQEDLEIALENGYYIYNNQSVCIGQPEYEL